MIQAIEVQVISKILTCEDQSVVDSLMSYAPDKYFSAYLSEIQFIHNQKSRYGIIPSIFDFQAQFNDFSVVAVPEPLEYLTAKLREYRQYLLLIETFNKIKDLGDGDVKDAWRYIGIKAEEAGSLEDSEPMDIVKDVEKRAEQIKEYSKQQRIPTGFAEIDRVMYGGFSTVEELAVLIARTNAGKAQPLYAPVFTPSGWVKMGDLKIGDEVVGRDNEIGKVVQIFPQGVKDYYRIHFDDGTSVECCDDHLWTARQCGGKQRVVTTQQIRKSSPRRYSIDLTKPIQFGNLDSIDMRREKLARLLHVDELQSGGIGSFWSVVLDNSVADEVVMLARSLGMWVKAEFWDKCHTQVTGNGDVTRKIIESVEYVGKTECQCILLDNKTHTYLTNDFTITHNSWVCTRFMESAQSHGFPVAYYSPEMQSAYLGTRFDTWRGHFENNKLFRGDYSAEYYNYMKGLRDQDTSAFVIEDKDFPDGVSVRTLEPFVKKHKIKLLVIDGISYMQDDQRATRDQEKFKNIAMGLFSLSKKYGCAVVLVMQANRDVKSKDDKGESIPTLYNAEGSDQPARIATQAFGIRQIFDKHVLDIGLLKSRMADNRTPVFSYAWDINTGQVQYIPGDNAAGPGGVPAPTPQIAVPPVSYGSTPPDSSNLSLIDDTEDSDIEF